VNYAELCGNVRKRTDLYGINLDFSVPFGIVREVLDILYNGLYIHVHGVEKEFLEKEVLLIEV